MSPSRSPSTTPASPQPSNPDIDLGKLSKWDRQLVQRLQKIGVNDAQPVEQGFRGSNVGGHDGTRYVSVSTTEQDVNYDADLVRTMRVQGVEVRVMKFGRTPDALHFNCDVLHYDVRKFEGPEAGDVDIEASHAFAERLITSLDCH